MQPGQAPTSPRPQLRAPGSFSSILGTTASSSSSLSAAMKPHQSNNSINNPVTAHHQQQQQQQRPPPLRIDSTASSSSSPTKELGGATPAITVSKSRAGRDGSPSTPIYNQFASHPSSAASPGSQHAQTFVRPQLSSSSLTSPMHKSHARKHSATQGLFDSTLPSASASSMAHAGMSQANSAAAAAAAAAAAISPTTLTPSQMAAKAAVMSHQNISHVRQRSQTVPFPGDGNESLRRGSGSKVPLSPPLLSLTEASAPRDNAGFAGAGNQFGDRLMSAHSSTATAAANVVFPRSGPSSPRDKSTSPKPFPPLPPIPPPPPPEKDKPANKIDKPKVKLFSRPVKIGTGKTEGKENDKPLPSPGKIGTALTALQRGNFSTTSLVDAPSQSIYSLNNSSSATIRPIDSSAEEKGKEKEKKHHFLSRQKQKLKDEYHLPLSSAASNSKPTDPNAPSSLYNFNVPASPGPGPSTFSKTKKDKKLAERSESRLDHEPTFNLQVDWSGTGNLPPLSQQTTLHDPVDPVKLGLQNHVSLDDAWPYLKAKLLVIFEGEDLRLPVEDFNRVVQMHIQWCIHKRSPGSMLEDLHELLQTGFSSLDRTLRMTPEDLFVPTLVELWLFTFTSILPYMQSVFLPLELEVSGCGIILSPDKARDFWIGVVTTPTPIDMPERVALAASMLDVRRLVLSAFRDIVILLRYDTLKKMFSRLSLEFLPSTFANVALASPPAEPLLSTSPSESFMSMVRPGTAMSLDPSVGSYNSSSTTLLGDGSERGRSRAVSNVSFGSHASGGDGGTRPFTPSGVQVLSSVREQNVEDSKQVTDMVGRMLQCMSVLSSVGGGGVPGGPEDESNRRVVELCKMLKLNWLGRGRTGRNRMGIVGGKVRRDGARDEVRVA